MEGDAYFPALPRELNLIGTCIAQRLGFFLFRHTGRKNAVHDAVEESFFFNEKHCTATCR